MNKWRNKAKNAFNRAKNTANATVKAVKGFGDEEELDEDEMEELFGKSWRKFFKDKANKVK